MSYIIIALLATVAVAALRRDEWANGRTVDAEALRSIVLKFGVTFVTLGAIIAIAVRSVVIVAPGTRGVIFNTVSGIRAQPLGEGINFVLPVVEQVTLVDIRVQKDSYDASAASKDLQVVHTKVALNFHPLPDSVARIFQTVGLNYSERLIHPAVQEAVKATTARFTAEELVVRREDVKAEIKALVEKQIVPYGIKVDELYITDFDFSRQFAEAIETKQIAEQQALKAKRDLDRIKIEADQKIATARAEAESLKMQREALTPQLIELRKVETQKFAIDKWDGKLPTVMMGGAGGGTPLLDLRNLTPGK
ncbi:MAG: prohibitin family protein [Elusimicrobia bacterium]|nr:prohibitin family protein [Elusimicrobiota bacterium]